MADENVIRREFQAELTPVGDGRTLYLRIVPYNKVERVSDGGPAYDEEWAPGVFRNKANKQIDKVLVNVEHERGFAAQVARAVGFTDTKDGFDGEFRMLNDQASDKALELVNEGIFTGVSVEAEPLEHKMVNGVLRRTAAKLKGVALCRNPAFPDARVLAVREAPDVIAEPEPDPTPEPEPQPDPEPDSDRATAVLARIGYEELVLRAIVDRPWDGSAARFEDDEYERACLVCRSGDEPPKTRCSLPVLEPNGDLNINGMHAAASRLSQTGLSMEEKAQAARKLVRYYRRAKETPPPSLVALASR